MIPTKVPTLRLLGWILGGLVGCKSMKLLAPQVGFEPTTLRLTAECSCFLRTVAGRPFSTSSPKFRDLCHLGSRGYSTPRLLVTGRKFRESCPCSVGRRPLGARGADGTTRKCPFTPTEFGDSGSPPAVPRAEIPRIIAPSSTRMLALPNSTAREFREWFPPGAAREF